MNAIGGNRAPGSGSMPSAKSESAPLSGNALQVLGRAERTAIAVAFIACVAVYTYWIDFRFSLGQGDNAFFAQMLDRMAETGLPLTQVAKAVKQLFDDYTPSILTTPAAELCKLPLPGPGPEEFNFFLWHTYFVLYPYLPVFKLLGGQLGMSLLTAVSFLMVVFGAYIVLRRHGVPVALSAVIGALLMLHPVWAGGVSGQFYGDRLFVGPAFVLCVLLLTRRFHSTWLYVLALLLSLTSERVGFMVGALLVGAVVLSDIANPRQWWRHRWVIAAGVLCFALSAIIMGFFSVHQHYYSYTRSMMPDVFLETLRTSPAFVAGLLTLVAINFVAWGIPALGCWRGLLLTLGVMLPNILGNYGGAEKTGFTTHYHSLYFPVLAASVCLSLVYIYRRYPRHMAWLCVGWLAVAGLAYNFETNQYDFRMTDLKSRPLVYPFQNYAFEKTLVEQRRELAAYMAQFPGTRVATNEPLMPSLYRRHSIAYYPLGLDDSDFVVVPRAPPPGVYGGMFSYLGPDENARIDACLLPRLEAGYHVQKELAAGVVLARNRP